MLPRKYSHGSEHSGFFRVEMILATHLHHVVRDHEQPQISLEIVNAKPLRQEQEAIETQVLGMLGRPRISSDAPQMQNVVGKQLALCKRGKQARVVIFITRIDCKLATR